MNKKTINDLFEFSVNVNTGAEVDVNCETSCYDKVGENTSGLFVKAKTDKISNSQNGAFDPENGIVINLKLKSNVEKYVAIYKHSEFWNQPNFGNDLKDVPDETQLLIVKTDNSKYLVLLPVCGNKFKCVFKGGKKSNEFVARVFTWDNNTFECDDLAFVFAEGDNPFELIKNCVADALKLMESVVNTIENRHYPEIFEYLGWCSWDSMQIRVSECGIIEKCDEFKKKSVPVKWAIIDDMHSYIKDFYGKTYENNKEMMDLMHSSRLYDYKPDPERFPNGLDGCIAKIKEYGIDVGMWYPTTGYWHGVDRNGPAYEVLKDYLIEAEGDYIVPDWQKQNSYMYYSTVFDFFKKSGADFVKIDNQSMTRRFYYGLEAVGKVAKEFHGGMEAAAGEYFDGCMINCMGTSSEDMWHRTVSPITRVSGDFLPENKEWFSKHVMQCAYTSLLMGQFYYCDWDMWWTDDGQNEKNSLLRAVSGGPIYVSDKIGRTNPDILKPLTFENGKILRCDRVCTPTEDCLVNSPLNSGSALKLQNIADDCAIMAVFNVDEENRAVNARISARQICGFAADEYLAYEYFSKDYKVLNGNDSFEIQLSNNDEYRLYIFVPIKDGYAPVGRTDKFITPKGIKFVCDKKMELIEKGPSAYYYNGKMYFEN